MFDVITVGSACVDVFAKTDSELITIKSSNGTEELIAYPCGSKILMKKLDFQVGGGGTNCAVAFSRLGLKTGYLGNIGNDGNGKKVLDLLKRENIDFVGTISEEMTNYSVILDSIGDDRTILCYKDASEKLDIKLLDDDKISARWFYFCAMDIKILEKLTKIAEKKHIKIAFNPSNYLADKGAHHLIKVLKKTNLLILNDEEAQLLVGRGPIPILLDKLSKLGPKIVAITQGPKGADLLSNDIIYHMEPKDVKVVETTGAGDSFGASLVSGLILQNSVVFALQLATENAAAVVSHIGSKNKLLTLDKAKNLIKKSKLKIRTVNLKNNL